MVLFRGCQRFSSTKQHEPDTNGSWLGLFKGPDSRFHIPRFQTPNAHHLVKEIQNRKSKIQNPKSLQFFRNRYMNNGAPIRAVIAPTGSSRGAITVRATVSAQTTKTAPATAENGIT